MKNAIQHYFPCEKCNSALQFYDCSKFQNGIFGVKFKCDNSKCNHHFVFCNNNKLKYGSFETIRDLGISWSRIRKFSLKFSKIFDIGVQSKETIVNHQTQYYPILENLAEKEMKNVIENFNKRNNNKGCSMVHKSKSWKTSLLLHTYSNR